MFASGVYCTYNHKYVLYSRYYFAAMKRRSAAMTSNTIGGGASLALRHSYMSSVGLRWAATCSSARSHKALIGSSVRRARRSRPRRKTGRAACLTSSCQRPTARGPRFAALLGAATRKTGQFRGACDADLPVRPRGRWFWWVCCTSRPPNEPDTLTLGCSSYPLSSELIKDSVCSS